MQNFILEVKVEVKDAESKVSESEVYNAVQEKLKGLSVGEAKHVVTDVQAVIER